MTLEVLITTLYTKIPSGHDCYYLEFGAVGGLTAEVAQHDQHISSQFEDRTASWGLVLWAFSGPLLMG